MVPRWLICCFVTLTLPSLGADAAQQERPVPEVARRTGAVNTETQVTLQREAVTLEKLLAELGHQTGLKLTAGQEVRWDQVSLHVQRRPAAQVMTELAELLDHFWERGSGDRRTLRQDTRSRAYEEGLRRQRFERAADALLNYAALANRPPEYYARLKEALQGKEPPDRRLQGMVMDILSSPGSHAGLRLLGTLSREQLLALVSAAELDYYLPWREMSPVQRELALQVADEIAAPPPKPTMMPLPPLPRARQWVQKMGLVLNVHLFDGTPYPHSYWVRIANPPLTCGYDISSPPAKPEGAAAARGRPYPPREPRRVRAADRAAEYRDLEEMPFPARGFRQTYPSTWPEAFGQLAERLPFALYSDYFAAEPIGLDPVIYANDPETKNPPVLALEQMSVAEGLDALCARYGKVWWREGDALFFRSRTWMWDRLYQVPPPVLAELQQPLTSHGKLDRRGVDLLAGLTYRQLVGLHYLVREKLKRYVNWSAWSMFWLLRVYAHLTEEQKTQVLTAAGLPFAQMTPAQRRGYQEALFRTASLELVDNPPAFRLEQRVIARAPEREPPLCELVFYLMDEAERREKPRHQWQELGILSVPFPAPSPAGKGTQSR
jgi:hypothetical protein